jgi:hypothetical protein
VKPTAQLGTAVSPERHYVGQESSHLRPIIVLDRDASIVERKIAHHFGFLCLQFLRSQLFIPGQPFIERHQLGFSNSTRERLYVLVEVLLRVTVL